jgi:hypothetical protein
MIDSQPRPVLIHKRLTAAVQAIALALLLGLLFGCPLLVAELRAGRFAPQGTIEFGGLALRGVSTANQPCSERQRICLSERFGPDAPHFYRVSLTARWPKRLNWADREYVLAFFRQER